MRRRSALFAALAATATALLAPAAPASAAVTNGQIAYSTSDNAPGVPVVWLANPDGTNRRQVLVDTTSFRWSPDGLRVSYVQFNQVTGVDTLYVAAANLTGRRSLGRWDAADWTADGTALVAVRQVANGNRDLFLKPASGATATRLSRAAARGCTVQDVDVSGAAVLYLADCTALANGGLELHTATLSGTTLTGDTVRLTARADGAATHSYRIDQARFRANGRIVFTGCVAPASCPSTAAANLHELNGTTVTRLTALAPGAGGGFAGLAPAPVGGQLAVGLSTAAGSRVLIRPTGTVVDPLGQFAEDWQPVLAP